MEKKLIGIWGYPEPEIFEKIKQQYPQHGIVDLDVAQGLPDSGVLPDAYCRIMKNIIDNAVGLRDKLDVIVASVGREKCDSGWFAAKILKDIGFNVIETRYEEYSHTYDTPISKSNLPLKQKITAIMDGVIDRHCEKDFSPTKQSINQHENGLLRREACSDERQNIEVSAPRNDITEVKPEFGFWGVPPNDLDFLDIFPDSTHVYGWTRCVEAGRPADIDLEMFVDEGVRTVFFAQTFCAKMQLAKYLAQKHGGLYVDVDDTASNSVRAKIEAFIKLG